jgi:hypothetical protein
MFKPFNRCAPFNRSLRDLRPDDLNYLNVLNVLGLLPPRDRGDAGDEKNNADDHRRVDLFLAA